MTTQTEAAPGRQVQRHKGTLGTLNYVKGYGFIKRGGDQADLFFHFTALSLQAGVSFQELHRGQKVTFEESVNERDGRDIAINVWPL